MDRPRERSITSARGLRWVALLLALGACRDRDRGASPEAAIRGFAEACNADDPAAIAATVVPADRLARALACPDDSDTIAIAARMGEAYRTQNRGADIEIQEVVVDARAPVAVGASVLGCTAREAFEHARVTVTLRFAGERKTERAELVALDGVWRIVPRAGIDRPRSSITP